MTNLIAYKKYLFVKDQIEMGKHGELEQRIEATFTVNPSSSPQVVPDWVKDTDLYKLALQDGSIESLEPVSQPL